ncbi:hypothetical protein PHYPSEUDO_005659 [Phytophthora pseudosyringae]|uniref:Uncharacterized protein n=1 Tax=Phytophthora pseudosyringae TaxID=221518 RepID=A0A8T1VKI5_9STRA|nr:hypothetical protein PHYPSEUDO_005659 [Phytophthora pseudosyringae]
MLPWQLFCAGLCLLLCVPITRELFAVHSLEWRARLEPRSFVLARAFHRPLYAACLLLVALRAAFFTLTATQKWGQMELRVKVATFWLLDMPSVAMATLHGYIVLFAVRLVFRRRWPGATKPGPSGVLTAVFVAFCASLVALVTLVAIGRAEGDKWELAVPQWMTFGYAAVIWTALGLLTLKYEGQAVQLLWRYRRRNQWSITGGEDEEKRSCQRLPVLSISCLKHLAVCSTLLAELLVIRGIVCAVVASQSGESAMDAVDVDAWESVILHYFGWEVACVVVVLRMLHQTPIAVHCFSGGSRSAEKTEHQDKITTSEIDDGEIQVEFQVPSIRDLVADYVVPSNTSLLLAQRRGMEHENSVEHRYCLVHHSGVPSVGAEYVNCRCCREEDKDQFLSNANVPLLAEEYDPLTDGTLACDSAISISNSMKRETDAMLGNERIR